MEPGDDSSSQKLAALREATKSKRVNQTKSRSILISDPLQHTVLCGGNGSLTLQPSNQVKETKIIMEISFLLCRLVVFLVLFSICSATTKTTRPAFLYTRARGRCTPQFWSSRREAWPRMVPQTSTLSKVFGSRVYERYRSDLTLLESTTRNDDDENAFAGLVKEATAALLNSYARRGFPYSAWEVKTLVIQTLVSEEAARRQAKRFSIANQACN